ncbi:Gfo/Idh/MocA family protein [Candidatus Pelagibacter sp.]|uniref:Gfo/Idh/MocA family protein n=1 Tax=Candidatus Pelagibacter sp. TaxID=2024849 RepID=UPI003F874468|tara:strand:+ start:875 stop:1903 length:1029 start_codon:yes stop_codon:yes gene_type:complete
MGEVVKWGIIGLGNVAHEFAKSFYNTKNAKLIAIASKSENKLSKFKANFNIDTINCHNDYEKLLNNNKIDVVYIALPNNLHYEWVHKSLEFKKHILVEKPAFINFRETQNIFNHPNFNEFFLGEGFMFRYHPQITKIIELLKNNRIGQIISMQSSFGKDLLSKKSFFGLFNSSKFNKKKRIFSKLLGGGAILDHGSYTVSMSLLIASLINGVDIENFDLSENKKKKIEDIDVESSVKLIIDKKFEAEITASFLRDIGYSTSINGKNGKILITNTWNSDEGEIILINEEKKIYKIKNEKNIYSREIDEISNDILNNKKEASFPGTNKKDILVGSKILDRWIND